MTALYRFDELGSFQFERLCAELLELEADLPPHRWRKVADRTQSAVLEDGLTVPREGVQLEGPTVVLVVWLSRHRRSTVARRRLPEVTRAALAREPTLPGSLLIITNGPRATDDERVRRALAHELPQREIRALGEQELGALIDRSPELRFRMPSVLGVRDLAELVREEVRRRSTADPDAAQELARVFVPTYAYAHTLRVLGRHGFAVLTGPPEMGKTATARMVALAAMTAGWEAHECVRPDELWAVFARDRRQVFVADDAFGSTEYRPEAAERWALELDRVLRALDERHWLIWTSRPTPLRAGLRRIHREHGVERFPQPAEIQVAAAELDTEEKALILFRHAQAAALPPAAVTLVQEHGWQIVSHPHFTPERIRRFVGRRLRDLAAGTWTGSVAAAVREEIREPTDAMAASLRALGPEHRALLVALLDAPPGPVPERELAAAVRRHTDVSMPRAPGELVDRLTDHFVRIVPPMSVAWVHPSWRDLLIDDLASNGEARRRFLRSSSLDGLLLALSVGGGATGERMLPLLLEDADWDAAADRLAALAPEFFDSEAFRLLASLTEAAGGVRKERSQAEIIALGSSVLELLRRRWDALRAPVPISLLQAWFDLAAHLADHPSPPAVTATWIELLPTRSIDIRDPAEATRLDDWVTLVALLDRCASPLLAGFDFPDGQAAILQQIIRQAAGLAERRDVPEVHELLARSLRRLATLAPEHAREGHWNAAYLDARSGELRRDEMVGQRLRRTQPEPDRAVVARVLSDLEPGE